MSHSDPYSGFSAALPTLLAGLFAAACASSAEPTVDTSSASVDVVAGVTRPLTVNDVSVLFPLPASGDSLWPASYSVKGGPLLSRAQFARIARSLVNHVDDPDEYDSLRVVALRYDPCFGGGLEGKPCVPQIRLVLQAFDLTERKTFDGAVHLLFDLEANVAALVEDRLRTLTALAPENAEVTALGVSPALAAQGLEGFYGIGLGLLIRDTIGPAELSRMTFMTRTQARAGTWEFGGFDMKAGEVAVDIPGLTEGTQLQTVSRASLLTYGYAYDPIEAELDAVLPVLDGESAETASQAERAAGYEALLQLENPTLQNADTVDCASCHVATRIRTWFDDHYAPDSDAPGRYEHMAEAIRADSLATTTNDNLRAFGYFEADAAISQRTANETIEVVRALNR